MGLLTLDRVCLLPFIRRFCSKKIELTFVLYRFPTPLHSKSCAEQNLTVQWFDKITLQVQNDHAVYNLCALLTNSYSRETEYFLGFNLQSKLHAYLH